MAARAKKYDENFDRELADLPPEMRQREFLGRIEAVIFAASEPVTREALARIIGPDFPLDVLIELLRAELRARPYDLVSVAGGFQLRTRPRFADALRASRAVVHPVVDLTPKESLALTAIAYFQPVTRRQIIDLLCQPITRDLIASLRRKELIASGPRSPTPGAPTTLVTTPMFLSLYGYESLADLPDMEKLRDVGLLGHPPLPEELAEAFGLQWEEEAEEVED